MLCQPSLLVGSIQASLSTSICLQLYCWFSSEQEPWVVQHRAVYLLTVLTSDRVLSSTSYQELPLDWGVRRQGDASLFHRLGDPLRSRKTHQESCQAVWTPQYSPPISAAISLACIRTKPSLNPFQVYTSRGRHSTMLQGQQDSTSKF